MTGEEVWAKSLQAPPRRTAVARTATDLTWAALAERAIVRGSR